MPSNILECPIAQCPIKHQANKAEIIPIGSFVNSPGGACVFEIVSTPIERKYLDFKGLFEKPFHASKIKEELAEYDNLTANCILSFLSQYRVSMSYKVPSIGRMFWVWLAVLLGKDAPHWYLSFQSPLSPYWLMYHADESAPEHQGKNYYRSYKVKVWWINTKGKWQASNPTVTTIRWEPTFVDPVLAA